ncbi:hypothetical protein X943_000358 [Babesia divergens]|uniref:Uncharacterized protein n=1 Tax=Babesia divergens TaxID=32595 RepID=A0AAD9G6H9_BABDI|nr:hypothetical protein X943_000358 [Babesia divergens]
MNTLLLVSVCLVHLCLAKHKSALPQAKVPKIAICGEGLKGLINYQFDRDDEDALITTAAYLSKNVLKLFTGNVRRPAAQTHIISQVNYLTIDLNNSISPLETVGEKCFAIRNRNDLPNILCASGLLERNKWMNAIDASILCAETGVKSTLPLIPGEETLEEFDEEKPSGLNLFIHDGPMGRPEIYINGKTTSELEEQRKEESLDASKLSAGLDTLDSRWNDAQFLFEAAFDHLFPTFESSTNEPVSVAPIDEEALAEARAEAGMVDDSTPDMGYYKSEHSR